MRSSFYSYYHASSILLASMSGVVSIGFTAYLEVGWAVLFVAAVLFASRMLTQLCSLCSPNKVLATSP